MGVISEKKPRKLTLNKKSPNKDNAKTKKISKPDASLKRPKVNPVKDRKNLEVTKNADHAAKGNAGKKRKNVNDNVEIKQEKDVVVKIEPTETQDTVKAVSKKQLKPKLRSGTAGVASRVAQEKETNTVSGAKKNLKRKLTTDKVTIKVEAPEVKEEKAEDSVSPKRNLKRKHPGQKTVSDRSEHMVKKENLKKQSVPTKTSTINDNKKKVNEQKRKLKKVNDSAEEKKSSNEVSPQTLTKEHILECIAAIFHLTEVQMKDNKNPLFSEDAHPIFMQVTCLRIPKTPKRQMRILLPHSLVSANDEVALIVGDLEKGRRKDYEPTIEHYKNLLDQHGCTSVKDIIPMNQVKTEYDQFELKRRLVGSYDYFLVDGKISGHISHLLGKIFYEKRKVPTPIRMNSKDLKHEIEYALCKTSMEIHSHGNTHVMQIGTTCMTKEQISENILAACEYLKKNYPGGWSNIQALRIKGTKTLGIPIYITLKNKNKVEVPEVQLRRPKAYRTFTDELSTIEGDATVTVTPEGDVEVDVKSEPEDSDENAEDEATKKEP